MKKIRAVVVGSGNVGQKVIDILQQTEDFELLGVVRRTNEPIKNHPEIKVATEITAFDKVNVAILCSPSRSVKTQAISLLQLGINTVDSFDIHSDILSLRADLNQAAKKSDAVAIVASGWDPGSDSIIRALLLSMAPQGMTFTNFGPGMSMGHTVAVKAIEGILDALSMTVPVGSGIHRRMVYVVLKAGYSEEAVESAIKTDAYFASDETHVEFVDDIDALKDVGHGVELTRKGASGSANNQRFKFTMSIDNPALTAQMMVASARASMRQTAGAYTLIEIPVVDFLEGDRDHWVQALV